MISGVVIQSLLRFLLSNPAIISLWIGSDGIGKRS